MISKKGLKISFIPQIVGIFFIVLFVISAMTLWRYSRTAFDKKIYNDIVQLQKIFEKIQADCYIYSFEHEKNYIDFLNVIKFSSNRVGPMQLGFPQNWQGPYLQQNLRIQNKLYAMLKTQQGYFIVPGDGVRLANGKVIGKDLILDKNSDIRKLMQDSEALQSESGILAAEIKIGSEFVKNMTTYKWEMLSIID